MTFEPLFMERVWGGRRLADLFGKPLPEGAAIGESWELVDRPEAQSVVAGDHELAGTTLGELWRGRRSLFGTRGGDAERFPVLLKLLDCREVLSVQVHPPPAVAQRLGGEPKTEMWTVLEADEGAHLFAGLREGATRERFEAALHGGGDVLGLLQRLEVRAGDAMFLPSGRVHAIGAGIVIAEVQQNSDTTFRVFDFDRGRDLHVEESLASIDFDDAAPPLVQADGEALVHDALFEVDRLALGGRPRPAAPEGEAAVVLVTRGRVALGDRVHAPGTTVLVPADAGGDGVLQGEGEVLRVLLGTGAPG
jgi:mannose-6-phosphate isomerase